MQRSVRRVFCLLLVLAAALELSAAPPKMMSVTVEQTQARAAPSFLGRIVADLEYGDRVEVLEEKNSWARIVMSGETGDTAEAWVHMSALTTKRVVLKAGDVDVGRTASSAEVALAGKGFNEQVEAEYRAQMDLDYAWVDRMEEITVSWEEIRTFLAEGGLTALSGGE